MEVVYLLTAEIPSEFHCAQITTFHMQHVTTHLNKPKTMKLNRKLLHLILLTSILIVSCNDNNETAPEPEETTFLCCGVNPFAAQNVDNLDQSAGEVTVFPYTTSNGDGVHDYFGAINLELYPNNTVTIFDLNDNVVYTATDYYGQDFSALFPNNNEVADGTIPIGTYKYKLVIENEQTYVDVGYFCLFANNTSFVTGLIECGGDFDPIVFD